MTEPLPDPEQTTSESTSSSGEKLKKSIQASAEIAQKQALLKKLELTDLREVRLKKGQVAYTAGLDRERCGDLFERLVALDREIEEKGQEETLDEQATAGDKVKHAAKQAKKRAEIEVLRNRRKGLLIELGAKADPEPGANSEFDTHRGAEAALLSRTETLRQELEQLKAGVGGLARHPFLVVGGVLVLLAIFAIAIGNWWQGRSDPQRIVQGQADQMRRQMEETRREAERIQRAIEKDREKRLDGGKVYKAEELLKQQQQQVRSGTQPMSGGGGGFSGFSSGGAGSPVQPAVKREREKAGAKGTSRYALVNYLDAIRDGDFGKAAEFSTSESAENIEGFRSQAKNYNNWEQKREFSVEELSDTGMVAEAKITLGQYPQQIKVVNTEEGWRVHDSQGPWFRSSIVFDSQEVEYGSSVTPAHYGVLPDGTQFLYESDGRGQVLVSEDGLRWAGRDTNLSGPIFALLEWKDGFLALSRHPETGDNALLTSEDGITWTALAELPQDESYQQVMRELVAADGQLFIRVRFKADTDYPSGSYGVLASTDGKEWKVVWQGKEDGKVITTGEEVAVLVPGGFYRIERGKPELVLISEDSQVPQDLIQVNGRWVAILAGKIYESSDGKTWEASQSNEAYSARKLISLKGMPAIVASSARLTTSEFPGEWKGHKVGLSGSLFPLQDDRLIIFSGTKGALLATAPAKGLDGFKVEPLLWGRFPNITISEAGSGKYMDPNSEATVSLTPEKGGITLQGGLNPGTSVPVGKYELSISVPGYETFLAPLTITTESQTLKFELTPSPFDEDDVFLAGGSLYRGSDGQKVLSSFGSNAGSGINANINVGLKNHYFRLGDSDGPVRYLRLDGNYSRDANVKAFSGSGYGIRWQEENVDRIIVSPDLKRALLMNGPALEIADVDWSALALKNRRTLDDRFQFPEFYARFTVWGDDEVVFLERENPKRLDLNTGKLTVFSFGKLGDSPQLNFQRHPTDKSQVVSFGDLYTGANEISEAVVFFDARDSSVHPHFFPFLTRIEKLPGQNLYVVLPQDAEKGDAFTLDAESHALAKVGQMSRKDVADIGYMEVLSPDGSLFLSKDEGLIVGKTTKPEFKKVAAPGEVKNSDVTWLPNNTFIYSCKRADDPNQLGVYHVDPKDNKIQRLNRQPLSRSEGAVAWVKKGNRVIFEVYAGNAREIWRADLDTGKTERFQLDGKDSSSVQLESVIFEDLEEWQKQFRKP